MHDPVSQRLCSQSLAILQLWDLHPLHLHPNCYLASKHLVIFRNILFENISPGCAYVQCHKFFTFSPASKQYMEAGFIFILQFPGKRSLNQKTRHFDRTCYEASSEYCGSGAPGSEAKLWVQIPKGATTLSLWPWPCLFTRTRTWHTESCTRQLCSRWSPSVEWLGSQYRVTGKVTADCRLSEVEV